MFKKYSFVAYFSEKIIIKPMYILTQIRKHTRDKKCFYIQNLPLSGFVQCFGIKNTFFNRGFSFIPVSYIRVKCIRTNARRLLRKIRNDFWFRIIKFCSGFRFYRALVPNRGPDPKKGRGSKMLGSHIRVGVDGVVPLQGESPTNTLKMPRCLPSLHTRLAMQLINKKMKLGDQWMTMRVMFESWI